MKMTSRGNSMPLAAALCFALGAISASASEVDVNFYSPGFDSGDGYNNTYSGAAVVGSAGDTWNNISGDNGSGSGISLVNSAGASTGITLSYDTGAGNHGAVTSLAQNDQPDAMMNDYLFNASSGDITVTLDGLAANTKYNLYVYIASDDATGDSRAADVTATGDPFGGGFENSIFLDGDNYLLLPVLTGANGEITITEADDALNSSGEVDMNGLQLATVPDGAATLPLLATCGIGLILFARRAKQLSQDAPAA